MFSCKHKDQKKESDLVNTVSSQKKSIFTKKNVGNEIFNQLNLTEELHDHEYLYIKICSGENHDSCDEKYVRDQQFIIRGLDPGIHLASLKKCYIEDQSPRCETILNNYQLVQLEYVNPETLEIDKAINDNEKRKQQTFANILFNLNQHKEEVGSCVNHTNIDSSTVSPELNNYLDFLMAASQIDVLDYLKYFEGRIESRSANSNAQALNLAETALDTKYRASIITWFGDTGHWSDLFGHSTVFLEKIDRNGLVIDSVYLTYPYGYDSPEEEAKYHTDKGKDGKAKIRVTDISQDQFEKSKEWFKNSIYDRSFYDLGAEELEELKRLDSTIAENLLERRRNLFKEKWGKDFEFYKFQAEVSDPDIKAEVRNIEDIENYIKTVSAYNEAFDSQDWEKANKLLDDSFVFDDRLGGQYRNGFGIWGNNCSCSVNKLLFHITGNEAFKSPKYATIQPRTVRKRFKNVFNTYNARNVTIKSLGDTLAHNRSKEIHELKDFQKKKRGFKWTRRGLRLVEELGDQNIIEYDELNDDFAKCISKSLSKYELELHQLAELFDYYNRVKILIYDSIPANNVL